MRLKDKFEILLHINLKIFLHYRRLFVFKPVDAKISPTSEIFVENTSLINIPWGVSTQC